MKSKSSKNYPFNITPCQPFTEKLMLNTKEPSSCFVSSISLTDLVLPHNSLSPSVSKGSKEAHDKKRLLKIANGRITADRDNHECGLSCVASNARIQELKLLQGLQDNGVIPKLRCVGYIVRDTFISFCFFFFLSTFLII